MKQYVVQTEAGTSVCTQPFVEKVNGSSGGVVAEPMNLTQEEIDKIQSSDWTQEKQGNGLVFTPAEQAPLTETEQARADLKEKLEKGAHTDADIVAALKLIL